MILRESQEGKEEIRRAPDLIQYEISTILCLTAIGDAGIIGFFLYIIGKEPIEQNIYRR